MNKSFWGKLMSNNVRKLSIGLCLSLGLFVTNAYAISGPVGSVDGSFSVTPGGAATYSIPIKVPMGIGGIKPGVSLTYNSQAGNGLLGVGWNMSGLSTITRCPQNIAQDGQIRSVKLDANDKFCLDGQRLVVVSGTYGQSNTEYRTEQDIFSKIISKGYVNNGPQSFEVLTKDGLHMQFGDVAVDASGQYNSRFAPHGVDAVHIWAISSITDNVGNVINFSYQFTGDDSSGTSSLTGYNREYYPSEITYSGGGKLTFNYGVAGSETRPDPIVGYRAGGKVQTAKRLEKITVEIASRLVRDYTVAYKPTDANTKRSKVSTVTECGSDGQCLPATQVDWQQGQNVTSLWQIDSTYQLPAGLSLAVNGEAKKGIRFIDLNGDGFSDIVYHRWISATNSEVGAYLNNNGTWEQTDSYLPPYPLIRDDGKPTGSQIIDVNGDGLMDFVWNRWVSDTQTDRGAYINDGTGWSLDISGEYFPKHWLARSDGRNRNAKYVDLDGNGLKDQIYNYYDYYDVDIECDYVGGVETFCTPSVKYTDKGIFLNIYNAWISNSAYFLPDELFILSLGDSGTRFISNEKVINVQGQHSQFLDVNGDGLLDYLVDSTYPSILPEVYLNTGSGLQYTVEGSLVTGSETYKLPVHFIDDVDRNTGIRKSQGVEFRDLNSDGLIDIVQYRKFTDGTPSERGAYLNTGNGWVSDDSFIPPVPITVIGGTYGRQVYFRDLNGDGLIDILFQQWTNATTEERGAYLNTGAGWFRNDSYASPYYLILSDWKNPGTRLVDLNADGKFEILHSTDGVTELATNINESQVVKSFTTGFGSKTDITYKPLTDASVYTKGTNNCQYPTPCIILPMAVVGEHTVTNGVGGAAKYSYHYTDARIHSLGRGWLGFASRSITDEQTKQTTVTTYENTNFNASYNVFPFLSMPKKVTVSFEDVLLGNVVISETINNYTVKSVAGNNYYSVYLQSSTSEEKDLDGTPLKYTTTTAQMDNYGNATDITVDTKQTPADVTVAYSQSTTNTYDNDTTNWHLGRLTASSVTSTVDAESQTRNTAYGYYSNGMLQWTEDEPTDPDLYLYTEYTYDSYGNKNSVTVSGSPSASYPIATRATSSTFDYADNQFPVVTTTVPVEGAITQSEAKVYDARWGKLDNQTGPNGLKFSWTYDSFGRRNTETRPDNTTATMTYGWCDGTDSSCPAYAVYKVTSTGSEGATSTAYMDEFSRQIRVETRGLDGIVVHQDTHYDETGRIWRTSRPFFKGAFNKYWTTRTFDALSRVKTQINPDGSIISTDYEGLQTTISTERRTGGEYTSLSVRQTKNLSGQVEWVFDAHNNGTRYTYLPFGEMDTVSDPKGNVTIMEYDNRGRKTKLIDPDMGTWQYATDALGNLRWQKDAKNQETTISYDLLNRIRSRVDEQNLTDPTSVEKTGQWDYFTEADPVGSCRSIGKLKSTNDGTIAKSFCYDSLGRITSANSSFDGTSYSVATAYDVFSRVDTVTYPIQDLGNQSAFIKRNIYDAYGHLKAVQDGASNAPLWTAELVNASGNITAESLGNGLTTFRGYDDELGYLTSISTGAGLSSSVQNLEFTFDNLGNLVSRTDNNRVITLPDATTQNGTTESFTYDAINRVSSVLRDGQQTAQYQYDALGNITFNSELGTYKYTSTRPHAVTEIIKSNAGTLAGDVSGDGQINGLDTTLLARKLVGIGTLTGAQTLAANCNGVNGTTLDDAACIAANISSTVDETLAYDANGNMLSGIGGKVITYTAFNKPETITKGSNSTRFEYGADRSRYLQVATDSSGSTKTHYLGQLFERIQKPNGIIEYKNYIYAGKRMIAVSTRRSNNSTDLNYLHRDHINSTTVITDATGVVKERFSYDLFGKRRSDASWKAASPQEAIMLSALTSSTTHHGYTEHEFLEGVGLIHMNGRVYDPELGRFLSADPFVQNKQNLQSFNRYSYVLNNPLSFTDPSGYFGISISFSCGICGDIADATVAALTLGLERDFSRRFENFLDENGRTIVAIAITAAMPGNPIAAGFLSSLIASGGDLKAAVIGGITAGAFSGLHTWQPTSIMSWSGTGKIMAHGMVGGVSSVVSGGTFKAGFMSAAITQSVSQSVGTGVFGKDVRNPMVRVKNAFAAGAIGGTTSVLTGGKFKNGAMTGAYSRMFNDLKVAAELAADVEKIRKQPLGKRVLSDLEKSPRKFEIRARNGGGILEFFGFEPRATYSPVTQTIYMDAGMGARVYTDSGAVILDSSSVLAHELGHMHRDLLGITNPIRTVEEMQTIQQYENSYTGNNRINHEGEGIWP